MARPKSVLIHIGCTGPYISGPALPPYIEHCIAQYLLFNDGPIYVLTDSVNIPHLKQRRQVIPVALEDYASDKVARFNALYNYAPHNFWTVAATRLIYLENFLRDNGLEHVYHFENDVLVYFDISEYHHVFRQLYQHLAITPGGPDKCMTGFVYINNAQSLAGMTDFFIETLEQLGIEGTKKQYGLDMVHEMGLIKAYSIEHGSRLAFLPILPFGKFSQHYGDFGAIFDPAGWGQFVGGTREEGPGAKCLYIGDVLKQHPSYTVTWEVEDGLRCPYFSYDGNLVKINTLHIHSKNLSAFMSTKKGA